MTHSTATAAPGPISIQLFGSFCITIHGCDIKRLGTKTGNRLFAYLALHHRLPGGTHAERSDLAALLWPDTSRPAAMENLRHCISDMRAALGSEADRIVSPGRNTLALDLTGANLDTQQFLELAAHNSIEQMVKALTLYTAPLLNDLFDDWAVHDRERYQAIYVEVLERLAAQALAEHRPALAIEPLKRAFAANSIDETIARALMSSCAATGDYAGAQHTYSRLRTRLRAAFSTTPDPVTATLAAEIRKIERMEHKSVPAVPPSEGNLKGQKIGRLRLQNGPLIGRDDAVQELRAEIDSHRLVTLVGTGGIGKTQLAIAAATSAGAEYPDGVWFVDLSSRYDDSADSCVIAGEILSAMGERSTGGGLDVCLCASLGSKTILLVLDNCEQVSSACGILAKSILTGCPRVHMLATSRRPLRVDAEHVHKVASLTFPRNRPIALSGKTPTVFRVDRWTKYSAVALFQDRAMLARRSFELDSNNVFGIASICRMLDGIPLAIELVAPWVRSLSIQQIGRQLKSALNLFTNRDSNSEPRHRTLMAVVGWSYGLVSQQEQQLWRTISLFADGFTLAAAHAVYSPALSEPEIIQLITGLIDSCVLTYNEQDGVGRYSLPETMRAFGLASEEPSRAEGEKAEKRFLEYFVAFAEEAAPHLKSAQQADWATLLDRERANLRTACDIANRFELAHLALRLASAAWRMYYIRGAYAEGVELLSSALSAKGDASPAARACALADIGNLTYQMCQIEQAGLYYEEALTLFRATGDKAGIARALGNLSLISTAKRDYIRSHVLLQECLGIFQDLGNKHGEAATVGNLAVNAAAQGHYVEALEYHERSVILFRELEDLHRVGLALANIASIQHHLEQYDELVPRLRDCLELCRMLENVGVLVLALLTVMLSARRYNKYMEAARLAGAQYALRAEFQLPLTEEEQQEQNEILQEIIQRIGNAEYESQSIDGAAMSVRETVDCALKILATIPPGDRRAP